MAFGLYRLRQLPTNLLILICLFISLVCYLFPVESLPKLELQHVRPFNGYPVYPKDKSSNLKPQSTCLAASTVITTYSVTREKPTTITESEASTTTVTDTITNYLREPTSSIQKPSKIEFAHEPPLEQQTIERLRKAGIVIVFKTGAQEVSSLSMHVGTTLRYLTERDIIFFSDHSGSIGPFQIHDALRNVNETIRLRSPDFEIYRKIKHYQETGQSIEALKEDISIGDNRRGWKLDKYKFFHMVEEAYEIHPHAKWYVFVETDSYVMWENLIQWLETLDPTKPQYIGSVVLMGEVEFGHGGSGYVLSNAAMDKLLGPDKPENLAASWDFEMEKHCCGDVVLAIALKHKGVHVQGAHPLLNGLKPTTLTYGPTEHWCQPVVSMHHVLPHEVSSIWRFERRREQIHGNSTVTTFSELYSHFVEPHLREERDNWDNLSHGPIFSKKIFLEKMVKATQEAEKGREIKALEEDKHKLTEDEQARIDEEQRLQNEEKKKEYLKRGGEILKGEALKRVDIEKNAFKEDVSKGSKPKHDISTDDSKDTEDLPENDNPSPTDKIEDWKNKITKRSDDTTVSMWSDIEKESFKSFQNCFLACKARDDCFQYSWVTEETGPSCRLGLSFSLGTYHGPEKAHPQVLWKSGWMLEKIRKWTSENECKGNVWPE